MMITVQLIVIVLCMGGVAFFAGMETGAISIHRMRLRHSVRQGSHRAKILQGFLENPDRLLGTTLVGTNIFLVMMSVLSASLAVRLIGDWGEAVSMAVVSILVVIFCEYLPKAWFHSRPLERCCRYAGVLRFTELALLPISAVVIWLTKRLGAGPSKSFSQQAPFITREDLKFLTREEAKNGMLSPRESAMINRVFELSGKNARRIMIPRSEMTIVYSDTTIPEFFDTARTSDFTRMPVFDREKNEFIGIINVFYVLSTRHEDRGKTLAGFVRTPLFIPEDMPVDEIFPRLRRSRQPMCLVTSDQSQVTGLITTEDILEEIVGKL